MKEFLRTLYWCTHIALKLEAAAECAAKLAEAFSCSRASGVRSPNTYVNRNAEVIVARAFATRAQDCPAGGQLCHHGQKLWTYTEQSNALSI